MLARFLDLDDPQLEFAAENILEEIAAGRVTSAAARAETALAGYRGSRQERTLAKLRQLGANVTAHIVFSGRSFPQFKSRSEKVGTEQPTTWQT